jgi:hypothetical protein
VIAREIRPAHAKLERDVLQLPWAWQFRPTWGMPMPRCPVEFSVW